MTNFTSIQIPALIGNVVSAVATVVDPIISSNTGETLELQYEFGTVLELVKQVSIKSQMKSTKENLFPMVCLLHNFRETFGGTQRDYNQTELTLWIVQNSKAELTYAERYEENFTNVLYPIFEQLINEVNDCQYFRIDTQKGLGFTKYDQPNFGKYLESQGNKAYNFGFPLDAITLRLKLNLNLYNCLKATIDANQIKFIKN